MLGVICVAGKSTRARFACESYAVISKCLLPVSPWKSTILSDEHPTIFDATIAEMSKVGVTSFIVIAGDHNYEEIKEFLSVKRAHHNCAVLPQIPDYSGTAAAVMTAAPLLKSRPFLLSWSDMLFRLPAGMSFDNCYHNIIFTTSVSHRQWKRFDGVAVHGDRVVGLSPRSIEKPGPFLMTTGVYYFNDTPILCASIEDSLPISSGELPIEVAVQKMLTKGLMFRADSLDYFIDVGTDEGYILSMNSLFPLSR